MDSGGVLRGEEVEVLVVLGPVRANGSHNFAVESADIVASNLANKSYFVTPSSD